MGEGVESFAAAPQNQPLAQQGYCMSEMRPIEVLALCGSLRAKSFNRMAIRAAVELAPKGVTIAVGEIGDYPAL